MEWLHPLWFTSIFETHYNIDNITVQQNSLFYRGASVNVMVGYVIYSQRLNKTDELVTSEVTKNYIHFGLFL
jgi:hypothetical protein